MTEPTNPFAPPHQPAELRPAPVAPAPAQWGATTPPAPRPYPAPQTAPWPAHPIPAVRKRRRTMSVAWVVPLVVLSLVAGLLGGFLGAKLDRGDKLGNAGLPVAPTSGPTQSVATAAVAAAVLPSVVLIETTGELGTATGSGFVLRADGYLLTNNHVVADADGTVRVTLSDGREADGRVVGATVDYDLAVVKIDIDGLTPLALGDSDAVAVGDPVIAVGAPLGLAGTVTTGIISATHRPVRAGGTEGTSFIDALQTDAAINPGNSGGPLVDATGTVVGITSAIAQPPGTTADNAGSIGLGFAIPANQARRTATQLIETGQATYPIIGVLLDESYVGEGVRVFREDPEGQEAVAAGGPADRAGIRRGDVILAIDGRPVTIPEELIVAIRARTPGDTVVLRVRTGTSERDVPVVLDETSSG